MSYTDWDSVIIWGFFFILIWWCFDTAATLSTLNKCSETTPYVECYKVIMGE